MKSEIEFSDKRETRGYAHEFVKRLNEAKQKGFKITGIGEKELRSFELSGNQTRIAPEKNETRSIHEKARIAREEMRDYDLSARAKNARASINADRAEEAKKQKKLDDLHIVQTPEKKSTNLFL